MKIYLGQHLPYHLWSPILRSIKFAHRNEKVTIYCDEWDYKLLIDLSKSLGPDIEIKKISLGFLNNYRRLFFIFLFPKYFYIALKLFLTKRKIMNDDRDIAIWELAYLTLKKGNYRPSLFNLIQACYSIHCEYIRFLYIYKNECSLHVLGHKVYGSRIIWHKLRDANKRILLWGSNNFIMHSRQHENRLPFLISLNQLEKLNKDEYMRNAQKFWADRLNGKMFYKDAAKASYQPLIHNSAKLDYPRKVVMLHVFRDSPFFSTDSERIFNDYFDWFAATLKYISISSCKWVVRTHPSSRDWGEDQIDVIDAACKFLGIALPVNLIIDNGMVSNEYIFRNCDVIVTYQGSATIEALAFGKKIISIAGFSKINPLLSNPFLVPKSVNEYIKLIDNTPAECFLASNLEIAIGLKLLYAKEYLLSLSKYSNITASKRAEILSVLDEIDKGKEFDDLFVSELSSFLKAHTYQASYQTFPDIN